MPHSSPATNSITELVLNWNRSGEFNWLICSPTKLSHDKINPDRRLWNGCFKIPLANMKKEKLPFKRNGTTDLPLHSALSMTSNNAMRFSQLWPYLLGNCLVQCRLLLLKFANHILKGKIQLVESRWIKANKANSPSKISWRCNFKSRIWKPSSVPQCLYRWLKWIVF